MSAASRSDGLTILDGRTGEQRARWEQLWQQWPQREVHAHPAYVGLFCGEGERPLCAAWAGDGGHVLYAFVARDLTTLPWAGFLGHPAVDLVTPYGYGGPFAWGPGDRAAGGERFWAAFDAWAREAGVVCETVRFSLFPEQLLDYPGETTSRQPNVVRDLAPDLEAIWRDFDHKVRKNVHKAKRSGVRVEVDAEGRRLGDFLGIYGATMDRRGAGDRFYFPERFFETLGRDLAAGCCYFHALHEGEVVSTELVLLSASTVYSFLGGTDDRAFDLRPNDLLKHEIIVWAKRNGYARYVLGGGYEPDDGIFRYKRSFAPGGAATFRIGSRIHRRDVYARLVEARAAHERARGNEWSDRPDYFPAYRG